MNKISHIVILSDDDEKKTKEFMDNFALCDFKNIPYIPRVIQFETSQKDVLQCLYHTFIDLQGDIVILFTTNMQVNKYWYEAASTFADTVLSDLKAGALSLNQAQFKKGEVFWMNDKVFKTDGFRLEGTLIKRKWYMYNMFKLINCPVEVVCQRMISKNSEGYNLEMYSITKPLVKYADDKPDVDFKGNSFYSTLVVPNAEVPPEKMDLKASEGISFLVPTYNRPGNVDIFARAVDKTCAFPENIEIVFGTHEDDEETQNKIMDLDKELKISVRCEIISKYEDKKPHLSFFWNQLYEKAKYGILGFFGDDVVFQSEDWDRFVFLEFRKDKHILVLGNDHVEYGKYSSLFFTHKETHQAIGYYMYPKFRRHYMDVLIDRVYRKAKKTRYFEKFSYQHNSAYRTPELADATTKAMEGLQNEDSKIYYSKEFQDEVFRVSSIVANMKQPKVFFKNGMHLGDCVFHLHYLRRCALMMPDTKFFFYVDFKYLNELNKHIEIDLQDRIFMMNINNAPDSAIDCWIGRDNWFYKQKDKEFFDTMYLRWFDVMSKEAGIENPIKEADDMIMDNPMINNELPVTKLDYLIINSYPGSGQINYNQNNRKEFDAIIRELARDNEIITTLKVDSIPCTMDNNLGLCDIGKLSIGAKKIIMIHTAPHIYCVNKWNIDKCERWIVVSSIGHNYQHNDRFVNVKSFKELQEKLNEDSIPVE